MQIRNRAELLAVGPAHLRADALDIVESAIRAADPYTAARRMVQLEGDLLTVGERCYDLSQREHIYVLGAGKATQAIALALEEILGERITDGVVALKHGESHHLQRIRVIAAAHPVPDEGSLQAGEELLELARRAGPRDLVISAVTGGSSSLAVAPAEGITLADKQALNRLLLECGATIFEINAVRKHGSRIKGGRLALETFPAELICLTVSDVVGDALDYITDLTVPDTSTYQDAWNTLDKYALWDRLPESVRTHLRKGHQTETPKSFASSHYPLLLVAGDAAFRAALQRCSELGYQAEAIDHAIEGEARAEAASLVGRSSASFSRRNDHRRYALVATGEAVVTISGAAGRGGPNQEMALSAALALQGHPGMVFAAVDADGTDGPTDATGGLVDAETVSRAEAAGLNAQQHLDCHNSLELLAATHDLIDTGPTGTNVNDLMLVLVD